MFRWTAETRQYGAAGGGGGGEEGTALPPRRPEYAAVVASGRDEVFAFGGGPCGDDRIHVHVFNTVSLRWRKLEEEEEEGKKKEEEAPPYLTGHAAVMIDRTVYFLGECGYPYLNVLHTFAVDASPSRRRWSQPRVSGCVPAASYDHSACVLGAVMLVYGGRTWLTGYIMDNEVVHRLDTAGMAWTLIRGAGGAPPPVLDCHSATVVGTRMLVCGTTAGPGQDGAVVVRAFDTETRAWLSPPALTNPGSLNPGSLNPLNPGSSNLSNPSNPSDPGSSNALNPGSSSNPLNPDSLNPLNPGSSSNSLNPDSLNAPKTDTLNPLNPGSSNPNSSNPASLNPLNPRSSSSLPVLLPKRPVLRSAFAHGGDLYMFADYARDLWRLDQRSFSWRKVEMRGGPPPMFLSRCVAVGDLALLFGADGRSRLNVVLDLSPSLKTLCKLEVIQQGLDWTGLPHDVRWELEALRPTDGRDA